jgi:hypothetical protein
MSIRAEAALILAKSILEGKGAYMTPDERIYRIVARKIMIAVQRDEQRQILEKLDKLGANSNAPI